MAFLLDLHRRPTIRFDVRDREHRRHYVKFLRTHSWRQCPVQFYLEQGYGDVAAMIENKLAAYYLTREFHQRVPSRADEWRE